MPDEFRKAVGLPDPPEQPKQGMVILALTAEGLRKEMTVDEYIASKGKATFLKAISGANADDLERMMDYEFEQSVKHL